MNRPETAVVTGSAIGIGLGVAEGLAVTAAHLIRNKRGPSEAFEEERQRIDTAFGNRVVYHRADVAGFVLPLDGGRTAR